MIGRKYKYSPNFDREIRQKELHGTPKSRWKNNRRFTLKELDGIM
jgi:hypothetical protein